MTSVTNTHILLDDQGRAWIAGTNTKVIEIVLDKVSFGWSAEEMHRQHPHLPLAKIQAALSYYFDHQVELDAQIEAQVRQFDQARKAAGTSPAVEKLRKSGRIL